MSTPDYFKKNNQQTIKKIMCNLGPQLPTISIFNIARKFIINDFRICNN